MSAMNDYHDQAMEAAFLADLARGRDGDEEKATALFARALDLELKALAELTEPIEPTHSIFHRSAGWLALDCNQPRLAEKLACKALAGDPPAPIDEQLRELLDATHARLRPERTAKAPAAD